MLKKIAGTIFAALLFLIVFASAIPQVEAAEGGQDLFFSEYVEGSRYNKAFEIYNGTGSVVDLSDYEIELYSNGVTEPSQTFALQGTLANGDVFVIANSGADSQVLDVADVTSGIANFNGDDLIVLKKAGEVVDAFGEVGRTDKFAENVTLIRKVSVTAGDTVAEDSFNVSTEWDSYPMDTFDYLGSYQMPEEEDVELETISEARQSEEGAIVKVEGVATASFLAGGQTNLYIQDETAGIIVRAPGLTVEAGDRVVAKGEFSIYYGMEQITTSSADVEIVKADAGVPEPNQVSSSQLTTDQGEEIEAEFVQLSNVEIVEQNQYGDILAKDDAGTFYILPPVEGSLEIGKTYEQVKGVVEFNYGEYKLVPRSSGDIIEKVFAVTANPSPGKVVQGTEVSLSTAAQGAEVHFTVDGTTPTANSPLYTKPIVISNDTTIQAVAVRDDGEVSEVATFEYEALKPLDELEVHDIQGTGHTSPYEGQQVTAVEGIVTKLDGTNGFYMQSKQPDEDIATSEGIYVFARDAGVAAGDTVSVSGEVTEWREEGYYDAEDLLTTQISASEVSIVSTESEIPQPVVLGIDREQPTEIIENDGLETFDPREDGIDFYESLEGMLIELPDPTVSGPVKYEELPVYATASENQLFTRARGLLISANDYNPERLLVDVDGINITAKTGDYFNQSITGVLSYDYSNYKLRPVGEFPELIDGETEREVAELRGLKQKLTIASYNVENFSAETDPAKVEKIAESIVKNMNTPDIVGLIEVQDNNGAADDGTVAANQSYKSLIEAIEEAGGPNYNFTDIAPQNNRDGGQPGGNIRVGFIYNPERVSLTDKPKGDAVTPVDVTEDGLTLNPGRIDPMNDAFYDSRKPLAAEFEFNGEKVIIIANHFNSKGGDDGLFGASQPVELASEAQRIEQAEVVNDFVQEIEEEMTNPNVVVLGDLNDFVFSEPVQTLKGDILTNLMNQLPPQERYTYIYQGNSQVLDHILVSDHLAKQSKIESVNINADFSEADGRASDHDPVLSQIHVKSNQGLHKGQEREKHSQKD